MKSKQTISKLKLCLYAMNVGIQNARSEVQDVNADAMDADKRTDCKSIKF